MNNLNRNWTSSISLAHKVLRETQEAGNGKPISIEIAKLKLQTTPGIVFASGTTFEDVFNKLESYKYIIFDKEKSQIKVLD